ncbi:MAG: hypothetical protein Tsb009_26190 [Planctomycetaceae bacterium]
MTGFQYSLNCSTIKPAPLMEKISIAGSVGYSGIELWHDDIDEYLATGGTLADIRNALADAGLSVVTTIFLKGWWDTTGDERREKMEEIKRRMNQAAEVGARHCVAGPPHGDVDYDEGAKNYRELLEVGLEMGVRPSAEYLGFANEFNTIEKAVDLITRCGHPEATIVHDPFHIFRGGGSIESVGTLNPKQIAVFHFNDAPTSPPREKQHDPDRVMPGDGHLNLKRICDLLREIGYDGWLSLELFNRDLWEQDPREVARIGLEKMRAVAEA